MGTARPVHNTSVFSCVFESDTKVQLHNSSVLNHLRSYGQRVVRGISLTDNYSASTTEEPPESCYLGCTGRKSF